jgi:thioredoxin:protein disulfide reductase
MGCLATLIVSPCVSAPLVGVLGYIGKTGDAWLGGTALFTLGLGIGSPLLLMGLSGGKLLPKVGPWMNTIKILFGILFLAMAIYLLDRIVPAPIILLLWGALLLLCAVYIGNFRSKIRSGKTVLRNTVSLAAGFSGMILMVGAATGNTNPLQPLAGLINRACIPQTGAIVPQQLDFKRIRTFAELQEALSLAKRAGKPTLVDFYADWCVACKQMARTTFSDPRVISALSNVQLLKVDVTDNDAADKTLEQRLNVIAPPTILFFDQHGQEQQTSRVVGEQSPTEFLNSLRLNN